MRPLPSAPGIGPGAPGRGGPGGEEAADTSAPSSRDLFQASPALGARRWLHEGFSWTCGRHSSPSAACAASPPQVCLPPQVLAAAPPCPLSWGRRSLGQIPLLPTGPTHPDGLSARGRFTGVTTVFVGKIKFQHSLSPPRAEERETPGFAAFRQQRPSIYGPCPPRLLGLVTSEPF